MKFSKSLLLGAACLCLAFAAGCSRKSNRVTKVTVAGEALTKVEPDAAVLMISVVTQNQRAITAQQENARKTEAVTTAIKNVTGLAEIKTSDYTLQPQYDYRDNRLPKIVGYDARNSVIVTMNDLKNVGAVIDAASGAGANSIDNVSFILRQTSPARGQALADATQQAMNKAQSIAQALGGRVLRVVEENENSTVAAADMIQANMSYDAQSRPTPITSGHLNIKSNVQLIVEIET